MGSERVWPLPKCTVDEFCVEVRWLHPPLLRAVFLHVYPDEPAGIGYLTLDGEVSLCDLLVPDEPSEHPTAYSAYKLQHALRWLVGDEDEPVRTGGGQ